jgi:hypothetical protein
MKQFFLALLVGSLVIVYLAFPVHANVAIADLNSSENIFAALTLNLTNTNDLASKESDQEIVQRLDQIKAAMAKIRFCYNENCFYRNITSTINPPSNTNSNYSATISATIDRPSTVLDTADYNLNFINHRWQLIKGEEYTDVAEYFFNGDRYEIYSVHSSRVIRGNLAQARQDSSLRAGYLTLYYDIFANGVEKVKS